MSNINENNKQKVICIVLGINETRVLKYLSSKEVFVSFEDIYEAHKHYISMKYPLQLSQLLGRLLRKNLVKETIGNNYSINEKGKLILEVIKK